MWITSGLKSGSMIDLAVCVCVCVCVHLRVHVCMRVYMHVYLDACLHTYVLSTDCVTASSVNMFKNKVDTYLRRLAISRRTLLDSR